MCVAIVNGPCHWEAFPVMYLLCPGKVHLSIKSGKFVERCFFSCLCTVVLFCFVLFSKLVVCVL